MNLNIQILLVEDNPVNQLVTQAMLNKLGLAHTTVTNGQEALEALQHQSFQLVLMDCQMPIMDGFKATQKIRSGETPEPNIPIIALTAHGPGLEQTACLAAGMNDCLGKPLQLQALKERMQRWLPQT